MADNEKPASREVVAIAALGLVGITGGAVGAMAYDVMVNGTSSAALVSIASIGVGALATLAGASVLHAKTSGRTGSVDSEEKGRK